jgi:hypothetical protein
MDIVKPCHTVNNVITAISHDTQPPTQSTSHKVTIGSRGENIISGFLSMGILGS